MVASAHLPFDSSAWVAHVVGVAGTLAPATAEVVALQFFQLKDVPNV